MASTIAFYIIDVSPGMAEEVYDEETGRTVSKLDLCKEYVCRKISPKIQSGRKTEHAGVLTFGGPTDNPFFAKSEGDEPEANAHDPQDYVGVASIFPPQQARPQMLGVVQSIQIGDFNGNPMAALIVADKILALHPNHNRSKNWKKEVVLLTHAKAKVKQTGWDVVLEEIQKREIALRVIGAGYDPRPTADIEDEEFAALPKMERFWRKFCDQLTETIPQETAHLRPHLGSLSAALSVARGPLVTTPNSMLSKSVFRIGRTETNPEEAIEFPVRYSKATTQQRPQSLKKVIASQVARPRMLPDAINASQSQAPRASQSYNQSNGVGTSTAAVASGTGGVEADVSRFTKYFIVQKKENEDEDVEMEEENEGRNRIEDIDDEDKNEQFEEVEVSVDNCTKAYRFGSTWVPLNEEDFETLSTTAGFDLLGFIKSAGLQRHQEMGEVLYIWPDPDNVKSQITMSSIVQAMESMKAVAVIRHVGRDGSNPKLGLAKPTIVHEEGKHIEYLHWVQVPFAEDERNFFFPSLTQLKSKSGKPIEEHPLLPTEHQLDLMSDLVDEMDLDPLGNPESGPWYNCAQSYNPAIHRLREAIYHLAITSDLNSDPVPPPHPSLVKYINPPSPVVDASSETVQYLADALEIKAAPPPKKKFERKATGTEAREDLDIDALFGSTSPTRVKVEGTEDANGKGKRRASDDDANGSSSKRRATSGASNKVISNDDPIDDFKRIVSESSGNEFMEKAMADLGEVIKENLAKSFSTSAYKKALECLQVMREQAMIYEMTGEYNEYIETLEGFVKDPDFKHGDFWKRVEEATPRLGKISDAEADAALALREDDS